MTPEDNPADEITGAEYFAGRAAARDAERIRELEAALRFAVARFCDPESCGRDPAARVLKEMGERLLGTQPAPSGAAKGEG